MRSGLTLACTRQSLRSRPLVAQRPRPSRITVQRQQELLTETAERLGFLERALIQLRDETQDQGVSVSGNDVS
jgi:hypothetical protein